MPPMHTHPFLREPHQNDNPARNIHLSFFYYLYSVACLAKISGILWYDSWVQGIFNCYLYNFCTISFYKVCHQLFHPSTSPLTTPHSLVYYFIVRKFLGSLFKNELGMCLFIKYLHSPHHDWLNSQCMNNCKTHIITTILIHDFI